MYHLIPNNSYIGGAGGGGISTPLENQVNTFLFGLLDPMEVSALTISVNQDDGPIIANVWFGLYTRNWADPGSLLASSGAQDTSNPGNLVYTLPDTISLAAGEYLFAWAADSLDVVLNGLAADPTISNLLNSNILPVIGIATSMIESGDLPTNLSGITATVSGIPHCLLT